MGNILTARNHHKSHLDMPAEDDLGAALRVLFAKLSENRFLDQGFVTMAQRIPGHQADAVFVQRDAQFLLWKIRMGFHLDKLRNDLPLGLQFRDILSFKVGNADRLRFSGPVCFFQLAVPGQPVSGRLVDIQQIHVIHAQAFQRLIHGVFILILGCPELGGEEDLLPGYAALPHAAADCTFIHIGIRGINQPVAHLQGLPYAVLRVGRFQPESSDPDHRALQSVIQLNVFHVSDLLSFISMSISRDYRF